MHHASIHPTIIIGWPSSSTQQTHSDFCHQVLLLTDGRAKKPASTSKAQNCINSLLLNHPSLHGWTRSLPWRLLVSLPPGPPLPIPALGSRSGEVQQPNSAPIIHTLTSNRSEQSFCWAQSCNNISLFFFKVLIGSWDRLFILTIIKKEKTIGD